ncbi:MAG: hypothetical protein DMD36_15275 [Gemmatimonadetes bacterium]|nr:MAG: hypothetical protein DMD36_15275 [Gemmatimonadota bacterium]
MKLADDGYVVVLRADAEGRVRVLFPLDPGQDDFVRGGDKIEVRGRGDREAFYVDDREGQGVVLAARAAAPFKFDEFVRGDHWDYRVLDAREAGDDREAALLDIVQRMAPDGHFDYDVVQYTVASRSSYYRHSYSSVGVGFGWGRPYYRYGFAYGSCFDPFFYDPFSCGSAFYDPFYYGYDPFFYGPFVYRAYFYRPFIYRRGVIIYPRQRYAGGLFIDRVRPRGTGLTFKARVAEGPTTLGVGPRLRIPPGALLSTSTRVRAVPVSAPATTPVRVRDSWIDRPAPTRRAARAPVDAPAPEARAPERRDNRGGSERPAPERRGGGGVDRPAPSRGRDSGASGGGRSWGGGGGRASSGGGRGSAPSNGGGGRRRP